MSDPEQPLSSSPIVNMAPNQGAQGVFNAPVYQTFVAAQVERPHQLPGGIRNFLEMYLGGTDHPVPFGGRTKDLADLNIWLDDPQETPYLFLAAPAGRGKSALLAQWYHMLRQREDSLAVVFFPVSITFNTNLSSSVFPSLAVQLADLYNKKIPANISMEWGRNFLNECLRRPPSDGHCLLLILDGLDEAADWSVKADLFPSHPPRNVRVVVSARYLANDPDGSTWLGRLGWQRGESAQLHTLGLLKKAGIADVLQQMDFPLAQPGSQVDIIAALYRLSRGDPLLVRLYVDALRKQGEKVAQLQPEDLPTIEPGLKGYFQRWWRDQRELWSKDKESPLLGQRVLSLLNHLACALGPLSREDLRHLDPSVSSTVILEESIEPLQRLITGDGKQQGYVFTHPRLSTYFKDELFPAEIQETENHFLEWGQKTVKDLNDGRLAPKDVSPYLRQYYGIHLERANSGPEPLLALVSHGWCQARYFLEGSYSGFLGDVDRAWNAVKHVNQKAAAASMPVLFLADEIRCALCHASIKNLSVNIPVALIAALVKAGEWTEVQGLLCMQYQTDPQEQIGVLKALVSFLSPESLQTALDMIRLIEDVEARVEALIVLAPSLAHVPELLDTAREIAIPIGPRGKAAVLITLARQWPPSAKRLSIEQEALNAVCILRETREGEMREEVDADDLITLAPYLSDESLDTALDITRKIESEIAKAKVLMTLAPYLSDESLDTALDITRTIESETAKARVVSTLAPYLPSKLLDKALDIALSIEDEESLVEAALTSLKAYVLPEERERIAQKALKAISINKSRVRAYLLKDLVPCLPLESLSEVLAASYPSKVPDRVVSRFSSQDSEEVLATSYPSKVSRGKRNWTRAEMLMALVPHLSTNATNIADIAFEVAEGLERDDWHPAEARLAVAKRFPEKRSQILHTVLDDVRILLEEKQSLKKWREEQRKPSPRRRTTGDIIGSTAEEENQDKAPKVSVLEGNDHFPTIQMKVLTELASLLPEEERAFIVETALDVATSIDSKLELAESLAALVPLFPTEKRGFVALDALVTIRPDHDFHFENEKQELNKAKVLTMLAQHLPLELLGIALKEACSIKQYQVQGWDIQARVLTPLVSCLSPELLSTVLPIKLHTSRHARSLATFEAQLQLKEQDPSALATLGLVLSLEPEALMKVLAITAGMLPSTQQRNNMEQMVLESVSSAFPPWSRFQERAQILAKLATLAPPGKERNRIVQRALNVAMNIGEEPLDRRSKYDERERIEVLIAVGEQVPVEERGQVLEVACAIEDEGTRAHVLMALTSHLPQELFDRVLEACRGIKDEVARTKVLSALALHLPHAMFSQARDIADTITWKPAKIAVQAVLDARSASREAASSSAEHPTSEPETAYPDAVVLRLSFELLGIALEASQKLPELSRFVEDNLKIEVLRTVVSHLPSALHGPIMKTIPALLDEAHAGVRAKVLTTLAALLPVDERRELVQAAFEAAFSIQVNSTQDVVDFIQWKNDKAQTLATLVALVPEEEQGKVAVAALEAVRSIQDHGVWEIRKVLKTLTSSLPPTLIGITPIAAQMLPEEDQVEMLAKLAEQLPTEDQYPVVQYLWQLASPQEEEEDIWPKSAEKQAAIRTKALTHLIDLVPTEQRYQVIRDALAAACQLPEHVSSYGISYSKQMALIALVRYLPVKLLNDVQNAIHPLPIEEQAEILLAWTLELKEQRDVVARAAFEVTRGQTDALTTLYSYLPAELLSQALDDARTILDQREQIKSLTALATQLPLEVREPVVQMALDIAQPATTARSPRAWQYGIGWARVLIDLAALVRPEQRDRIVKKALEIASEIASSVGYPPKGVKWEEGVKVFTDLETLVSSEQRGSVLQAALKIVFSIPFYDRNEMSLARALAALTTIATLLPTEESSIIWGVALAATKYENKIRKALIAQLPQQVRDGLPHSFENEEDQVDNKSADITMPVRSLKRRRPQHSLEDQIDTSAAILMTQEPVKAEATIVQIAFRLVSSIKNMTDRIKGLVALTILSELVPPGERGPIIQELVAIFSIIWNLETDQDRDRLVEEKEKMWTLLYEALVKQVAQLPLEERERIVRETKDSIYLNSTKEAQGLALVLLASLIPIEERTPLVQEARMLASSIIEDEDTAFLVFLAELLPVEMRTPLVQKALENVSSINISSISIEDREKRVDVLIWLISLVSMEEQSRLVEAVLDDFSFLQDEKRVRVLTRLATEKALLSTKEQDRVVRAALDAVRELSEPDPKQRRVRELSEPDPKQRRRYSLKTKSLMVMLPHLLSDELLSIALEIARSLAEEEEKADVLVELAVRLRKDERSRVVKEVLAYNRSDYYIDSTTTRSIVRRLKKLMTVRLTMEERVLVVQQISKLIVKLIPSGLHEVFYHRESRETMTTLLTLLAPKEWPSDLLEALLSALLLDDDISYDPFAPPYQNIFDRDKAKTDIKIEGLIILTSSLDDQHIRFFYPLWSKILDELSLCPRAEFLSAIATLAPSIAKLGGQGVVLETAKVVNTIAQWWP